MPEVDRRAWDDFLTGFPEAHLLQTSAWGELKAAFGWSVRRFISTDGVTGAQVLLRPLPLGFSIGYIPKGPVCEEGNNHRDTVKKAENSVSPCLCSFTALLPEIDAALRRERAVLLKVEPDCWEEDDVSPPGFRCSPHEIQPVRTLVVDLTGGEDAILARMKQETRYNIRLAEKKGVVVTISGGGSGAQTLPDDGKEAEESLVIFNRLMAVTGDRDRFGVHGPAYYRRAYELFRPRNECALLIAAHEDRPLAALMVFTRGRRAWYFYGASADEDRELMPTYLLQWEAMRWAIARGCTEYDLWGVPDYNKEDLETGFTTRSDGLWGVFRFKRGFGGELRRASGPWDRVYIPLLYQLYLHHAAGE